MIYKTLHRENEHQEFTKSGGELICSGMVSSSRFTSDINRVTLLTHIGMSLMCKRLDDCDYDKRNIFVVIFDTDIQ